MSPILSRVFAPVLVAALAACTAGGEFECISTPAPSISSSPPTSATVGSQYRYYVNAQYGCFPFVCNSVDGVVLPPGAVIDDFYDSVTWTPVQSDANTSVPFVITTEPDFCGRRATQSWSVYVSPETFPLRVTYADPTGTDVPVTSAITVTFSEPVDPQTVTPASFQVSGPSGAITGSLQTLGSTASFSPAAELPPQTTIAVTITTAIRDLSGLALASSYDWSFRTGIAPDRTPPTVPTGLSATRVTASEVGLAWASSTDDTAIAGYRVYRDGDLVQSVWAPAAWDTGLQFNARYLYTVSAYDSSGNESARSDPLDLRTLDFLPGNAAAWGRAYRTDGTMLARSIPDVAVACEPICVALEGVSAVAASGNRIVAVSNGSVWHGDPYRPSPVAGLSGTASVAGGEVAPWLRPCCSVICR